MMWGKSVGNNNASQIAQIQLQALTHGVYIGEATEGQELANERLVKSNNFRFLLLTFNFGSFVEPSAIFWPAFLFVVSVQPIWRRINQ